MTLNAVIRCSTCNKVSKKIGSKDGECSQCIQIKDLVKRISMLEEYYGVQKSDYYDDGSWHKISEKESNLIKKQARIFCGDGKL